MSERFAAPLRRTFSTLAEVEDFAASFAGGLVSGDVVALDGELGSGKTTFVRAAVRALHQQDETSSPTFTFWHRYRRADALSLPVVDHLDLYRIEDASEITELGLDDAFDGNSIVFVEWWVHAPHLLPPRRWEITIEGAGDRPRTVTVTQES